MSEVGKRAVARYFEMWNGGDLSIADEVLSPDWVDHAHSEIDGPAGVKRAVESVQAGQPHIRFEIDAILADGDLVAAVGAAAVEEAPATRLIWLIRVAEGRLAEMWTYRDANE